MWAYPLKQKDHAASTIRDDWLPFVERQSGHPCKSIRTDRGGEFLGGDLTAWLKKQGIEHQLTTSYTPQTKLGASALWCVHLGLAAESKGWLLWEPSKNCKWLAKIKTDEKGEPSVYKSRLVAKGFQQKEKEDYKEVFAPTAKSPTLRVLLAVAAVRKWKAKQMDIVTAFLYGIVEEEVYMVQPPGYEDGTGRVCKLNKAIYGLKQAPRCWYNRQASALEEIRFRASACDESLFLMGEGESLVLLLVYVDDILLFSSSDKEIDGVQRKLTEQFKCKSLGEARYYLGMHIERDTERGWLKLHQGQYINTLAEKYSLQEEREVVTPLPSDGSTVFSLCSTQSKRS
ncbi:hypothetical protein CLOM_g2831 [Closterium sp. NIES-68]|nr:hypothetical protein CLOM_g2831 [Closterium sp. NIES-68]